MYANDFFCILASEMFAYHSVTTLMFLPPPTQKNRIIGSESILYYLLQSHIF